MVSEDASTKNCKILALWFRGSGVYKDEALIDQIAKVLQFLKSLFTSGHLARKLSTWLELARKPLPKL